jgi:hypothetical protein
MSGILNLLLGSAAGIIKDAYFNLVTLLLNTTSTNGAQNNTFLDSSSNNFTITRNGNTTQGTFTPFSQTGWSNNMTSGYLTTAANAGFALSGDFTVECWVFSGDFSLDSSTRRRVFHTGGGDIASSLQLLLGTSGGNSAVISVLNNGFLIDGTINVVTNSWVHIAVARSGTSLKLFVNGVQSGSTATTSQNFNSGTSNTVYIGANSSGNGIWQGYISNLRVIVGTAIYTSAFTPPTSPFATGTTNQQLLVCASNGFADINTATTAKTITVNSTPSVQAFSPFAPTTAYSTSLVGGSGYFDGSGDYLNAGTSLFNFTTANASTQTATIEAWVYTSAYGSPSQNYYSECIIGKGDVYLDFGINGSGNLILTHYDGTQRTVTSSGTIPLNTWAYVACTISGGVVTLYINGTSSGTGTWYGIASAGQNSYSQIGLSTASSGSGVYFTGYISNIRVSSNVRSISIPTVPFSNDANTSFLLLATNAGIYDSAAKNDLETVGDAQVSTTQAKWGTTSIKFDGTGDWLTIPYGPNLAFGTGDFTIEMWIYPTQLTGGTQYQLFNTGPNNTGQASFRISTAGKLVFFADNSGPFIITGATTLSANTWQHVAVTRSGTTIRIYLNGSSDVSGTSGYSFGGGPSAYVGYWPSDTGPYFGYMDDIRITKGYARYSGASYTVPTAAFPIQ